MSLTDGLSSLSLAYAVSINTAIQMSQQKIERTLFQSIAEEHGFTHNGEYYESVGLCGVNLTRFEPISIQEFKDHLIYKAVNLRKDSIREGYIQLNEYK